MIFSSQPCIQICINRGNCLMNVRFPWRSRILINYYLFRICIFNSTTVNICPFGVFWRTMYGCGFYRAAINNNIRVLTADASSTCGRCSYRSTINSNVKIFTADASSFFGKCSYRAAIDSKIRVVISDTKAAALYS